MNTINGLNYPLKMLYKQYPRVALRTSAASASWTRISQTVSQWFTVSLNDYYWLLAVSNLPQINYKIMPRTVRTSPLLRKEVYRPIRPIWDTLFPVMFGKRDRSFHSSSSLCDNVGFLQKNNNADDKSRIVGFFNDQQTSKSIFTQDNERESRYRRTETDFSNLYARGEHNICLTFCLWHLAWSNLKN